MIDFDQKIIQKALEERLNKNLHEFDLVEHEKLNTKRKSEKNNEWFYFSLSYLKASKTLLEKAEKEKSLDAKMHIIPGIYNFRHAIELSLKFLSKLANTNYSKSHDLMYIYDQIYENLKKESYKKIKDSLKAKTFENSTEQNLKKMIDEAINNLSAIVNKYYFQTPLQKSLKPDSFFIEDQDNEVFKYPEARNVVFYYQSVRIVNLPQKELNFVILDVKKMITTISIFFTLFDSQKDK